MRKYQRKKLNKILLISAIVLTILAIIVAVIVYVNAKNKKQDSLYEDKVICNNYFSQIVINFNKREVRRDDKKTSMQKEFNVTEQQESILLSSKEELQNFFSGTAFEIKIKDNIAYIINRFQTKKLIVEVETLKGEFKEANIVNLYENIYLLEYDTQKRTKEAYEYLQTIDWIKKVEEDKVIYIEPINDESQTVYGETEEEKTKYNTYGIEAMGLANYKNIIKENGNPSDVIVATIGYGVCIENQYFNGRINEKYYNFIDDSKNIPETIPQGSRIAEVIKDATENNVNIMPLVVVNNEGYTTIATIIRAMEYAIQNSDIICYELVHNENYMINLILERAFKENKPVSCVTTAVNNKQVYPANSATTIAVSSIDKKNEITTYSGRGNYIDFTAYSTDIEEIFNTNTSVSKWAGSQYSNAHIVAAMALIKSYNKDYKILEIYNVLRNYCIDLGAQGKDEEYGYGCPDFSKITIKDIDKQAPKIKEVKYDSENWEKTKNIQLIAYDNIRIFAWAVTTSRETPNEWNNIEEVKPTLDITHEITENNKYFVWVKDSAENTDCVEIEINKIDTIAPEIFYQIDSSTLQSNKYVTISVSAQDRDSGLHEMPYSWDGQSWGADNNLLKVTENGRYKIYVRDGLDNIIEKEILIDVFPREGFANIDEGTIIKSIVVSSSWNGDTNNGVRITLNEGLNLKGWRITTSPEIPEYFEEFEIESEIEEQATEDENMIDENIIEELDINNIDLNNQNELLDEENSIYAEDFYTGNEIDENIIQNEIEQNLVDNEIQEDFEENEEPEVIQGYNSSFTMTKALDASVKYYVWIQDINDNVSYQTFSISKVDI